MIDLQINIIYTDSYKIKVTETPVVVRSAHIARCPLHHSGSEAQHSSGEERVRCGRGLEETIGRKRQGRVSTNKFSILLKQLTREVASQADITKVFLTWELYEPNVKMFRI